MVFALLLLIFLSRDGLDFLAAICLCFRASNTLDPNEYQISRLLVWRGLPLKVYEQKKADATEQHLFRGQSGGKPAALELHLLKAASGGATFIFRCMLAFMTGYLLSA